MKKIFFDSKQAVLTVMVQADNPDRVKELMDLSLPEGAEAFGMQFERIKPEYRKKEIYLDLFQYAKDRPIYVTNYRDGENEGKSDVQLAEEMLEFADCGADLCDVMGDLFDKQPDEVAVEEEAIQKQMDMIRKIHEKGAKVLMSSHVCKFLSAERVLEIAKEHEKRGADICKIVVDSQSMEEQLENLKIIHMLKENLNIPFLFLSVGESRILRRIGGELGCCMYLCVYEHDALATPAQPLLQEVKMIRQAKMGNGE